MRRALLLLAFLLLLCAGTVAAALVAGGPAAAIALVNTASPKKVIVCKYVGTPGVDERLQTGQNPISVDENALEGKGFAGGFPFEFSDAQGRSVAVRFAVGNEQGTLGDCGGGGETSSTTTTTSSTTTTSPTVTINPETTFTAGAFCVIAENRYRVVGTVNGNLASVDPQFIDGDKVGPTVVIVSLGADTAAKVVITDGTCVQATTTGTTPSSTSTSTSSTTTTTPGGGGAGGGGTTTSTPATTSTAETTSTESTTTESTPGTTTTTPRTLEQFPPTRPPAEKPPAESKPPTELPFTGLPLWLVAWFGLTVTLGGLAVRKNLG